MEEKDFVSLEVAKLLQERGYNEPVKSYYSDRGVFYRGVFSLSNNERVGYNYYSAPTLSEAAKWLREKHKKAVCPIPYYFNWNYNIYNLAEINEEDYTHKILGSRVNWDSYEEALSEGIKESLKIINKQDGSYDYHKSEL